ncbi:MAG: hypothetical protein AAGA54_19510, partial [Myxococcota bacterium]
MQVRGSAVFTRVMNILRPTVLALSLLSLGVASTPASAGKKKKPKSVAELTKYEFVEKKSGDDITMWIEDETWGRIGNGKNGYIQFSVAKIDGKELVHIDMVRGVKKTKGVGKLL